MLVTCRVDVPSQTLRPSPQANIKEAEVVIPARLHNSLIGSKGCLVRSIMDDCGGVHIHFPSEGSGSDRVTIRGPAGEVEKAKKQLLQLAEEKVRKWEGGGGSAKAETEYLFVSSLFSKSTTSPLSSRPNRSIINS